MVESFGYPNIPGEYGIPFSTIPLGFSGLVKGQSGRELNIVLRKDAIIVRDLQDEWFGMAAEVLKGRLFLFLQTRKKPKQGAMSEEKHPDFYASRFIDFAMRHFNQNDVFIKDFEAQWHRYSKSESTNYETFMEYARKGKRTRKNEAAAAMQTWSAKNMARYGFNQVNLVKRDSTNTRVRVIFSRETQVDNRAVVWNP